MSGKITAQRVLEFQKLLYKFSEIERLIYLPDGKKINRRENDIEHSYGLAMTAWFLARQYPYLDTNLVIQYALAHDLAEIYAGDVMAIGRTKEVQAIKEQKETEAINKLKSEWPDFNELIDLMNGYNDRSDPESKFVYAIDKMITNLHNLNSNGKTWKAYNFSMSEIFEAKDSKIALSPEIDELWQEIKKNIMKNKDSLFNNNK